MTTSKLRSPQELYYRHRLGSVYQGIKSRCYNSNVAAYKYYGGRGIKVCDEWLKSFIDFKNWAMKAGYEPGLELDRIDNDWHYTPDNCRFVTCKVNRNNTRIAEKYKIRNQCKKDMKLLGIQHDAVWTMAIAILATLLELSRPPLDYDFKLYL